MAGKTILLAEDHPLTRAGLAEFLRAKGYQVDVAVDGEEALAAFDAAPPDLLITDLDLPKVRGEKVIRRIRASHPEAEVAVITGETDCDTGRRAVALGVQSFFTKPLNLDEMARRIGEVLSEPRADHG